MSKRDASEIGPSSKDESQSKQLKISSMFASPASKASASSAAAMSQPSPSSSSASSSATPVVEIDDDDVQIGNYGQASKPAAKSNDEVDGDDYEDEVDDDDEGDDDDDDDEDEEYYQPKPSSSRGGAAKPAVSASSAPSNKPSSPPPAAVVVAKSSKSSSSISVKDVQKRLEALSKEQLVKLCLDFMTAVPEKADIFNRLVPAPSLTSFGAQFDALHKQIDKAAPRYANFDSFHFKRVQTHIQALKACVLESAKQVDALKQPEVVLPFLATAFDAIHRIGFIGHADKIKGVAYRALLTMLKRTLLQQCKQPSVARQHLTEGQRDSLVDALRQAASTDEKMKEAAEACMPFLQ